MQLQRLQASKIIIIITFLGHVFPVPSHILPAIIFYTTVPQVTANQLTIDSIKSTINTNHYWLYTIFRIWPAIQRFPPAMLYVSQNARSPSKTRHLNFDGFLAMSRGNIATCISYRWPTLLFLGESSRKHTYTCSWTLEGVSERDISNKYSCTLDSESGLCIHVVCDPICNIESLTLPTYGFSVA